MNRRVIRGPAGGRRLDTTKSQLVNVERVHKRIDGTNGIVLIDPIIEAFGRRVSDRITAYALFIDPPLGRAGMTDEAVRKSGRANPKEQPVTAVIRT